MKVSELIKLLERQNPDREVTFVEHKSDILHSTVFHLVRGVAGVDAKWSEYHRAWQEKRDGDGDETTDVQIVVVE